MLLLWMCASQPTDSSAELPGSLPCRVAAADRACVTSNIIYPCLGADRHDPANSHLHRVSPFADLHGTQHEELGLWPMGHLEVPEPLRHALQPPPYVDAASRSATAIFVPLCALCVRSAALRLSRDAAEWAAGGADRFHYLPEGPPGPGLACRAAVREPGRHASMHARFAPKVGASEGRAPPCVGMREGGDCASRRLGGLRQCWDEVHAHGGGRRRPPRAIRRLVRCRTVKIS